MSDATEQPRTEQLPATRDDVGRQLVEALAGLAGLNVLSEMGNGMLTSFDPNSPEGRKSVFRGMQMTELNGEDLQLEWFPVENVLIYPDTFPNEETGELVQGARTVLFSPDGRRAGIASIGVVKGIAALINSFGPPPWDPPKDVQIVEIKTQRKRRYYILDVR